LRLLKLIPTIFLVLIVLITVKNFYDIKTHNHTLILKNIENVYNSEVDLLNNDPLKDIIEASKSITSHTIVVLGGSTLIKPGPCDKSVISPYTFPSLLGRWLFEHNIKILNLGHCGENTNSILKSIKYISAHSHPKAFLIYTGHNDYGHIFGKCVLIPFRFINQKVFTFFISEERFRKISFNLMNLFETSLARIFNAIDAEVYSKDLLYQYGKKASEIYIRNLKNIVAVAKQNNIPIIIITPISNLAFPPLGANQDVIKLYFEGMKNGDINKLIIANEYDFLGYSIREKQDAISFVKSIKDPNVIIVNIYDKLIHSNNTKLFNEYFYDIFHLKASGHTFIFEEIKQILINEHNLISR
jgi:lysophospholipase L1-like esterase